MTFVDIKDPKERDRFVADYISTIKNIQQQSEDEKALGLKRQIDLEKTFNPIIKATEMSTKAITNEIKNIKPPRPTLSVPRKRTWDVSNGLTAVDYYLNKYSKTNLDKYYGIQQDGDKLMMGDKEITVDEDSNIHVDDETFNGTPGLWSLIMLKTPKGFTDNDFTVYGELVKTTDVMRHPRSVIIGVSRPEQTRKYTKIFKNIMNDNDNNESTSDTNDNNNDESTSGKIGEREDEEGGETAAGSGIQFLPGDIKGLNTKLNLLLAEFAAGNRSSTRNQIVGILDELKRRKRISRKDYTDINSFLAQTL